VAQNQKVMSKDLREQALAYVKDSMKRKKASREGTYLARIVALLLGEATEKKPLTRQELIAYVALEIVQEQFDSEGGYNPENEEHAEFFAKTMNKTKNQVAAALSNSKNNTALTFNPRYCDTYEWGMKETKEGPAFWLIEKEAEGEE
jgi:hypothetical protein